MVKAQKAALSIMKLLRLDPRIDNLSEEGEKDWSEESGRDSHIEFKTVTFRYPSRPKVKVLQGLSLKIPKGKIVALVGPSGSGKSTIMQLIQRFYDPEAGEVLIDGHDIKDLNVRELRRQIAVVSQEPCLFDMSILQNIRYGAIDDDGDFDVRVKGDDVMEAVNKAYVSEFV